MTKKEMYSRIRFFTREYRRSCRQNDWIDDRDRYALEEFIDSLYRELLALGSGPSRTDKQRQADWIQSRMAVDRKYQAGL